jgi:propanol-preferring alcohol dehydrogenase
MKAVQLVQWQAEPELREVDVPVPGPGEVLVKVAAAGLCHSDLHVMGWPEGKLPWELPFTLGHENAGIVAALGEGATRLAEGDAVVVYGPWGCGACTQCIRGAENLCDFRFGRGCGVGYDGGLAEYVLVPSQRLLVPIGDLDPLHAAPLTDAALSPYHALKSQLWRLVPGSSAVVIGVGGLGHVAVQLLRELSPARIVAIDLREQSRRLAVEAGATALDASGLEPADVRAALGGAGATLVLDFVGNDETLALAAGTIATGGHVCFVGVGGGTFPMAFGTTPLEWSLSRPSWGTLPELYEVVALARAGAIRIEVEQLRLDEAIDGYRRLRDGAVNGRAVVVP